MGLRTYHHGALTGAEAGTRGAIRLEFGLSDRFVIFLENDDEERLARDIADAINAVLEKHKAPADALVATE